MSTTDPGDGRREPRVSAKTPNRPDPVERGRSIPPVQV